MKSKFCSRKQFFFEKKPKNFYESRDMGAGSAYARNPAYQDFLRSFFVKKRPLAYCGINSYCSDAVILIVSDLVPGGNGGTLLCRKIPSQA
jgi:hypothetical protein